MLEKPAFAIKVISLQRVFDQLGSNSTHIICGIKYKDFSLNMSIRSNMKQCSAFSLLLPELWSLNIYHFLSLKMEKLIKYDYKFIRTL